MLKRLGFRAFLTFIWLTAPVFVALALIAAHFREYVDEMAYIYSRDAWEAFKLGRLLNGDEAGR